MGTETDHVKGTFVNQAAYNTYRTPKCTKFISVKYAQLACPSLYERAFAHVDSAMFN